MLRGKSGPPRSYEGRGPQARWRRAESGTRTNGSFPLRGAILNPGATCCARGHVGGHMTQPDFGGEEDQDRQPRMLPKTVRTPPNARSENVPSRSAIWSGCTSIRTTRHTPPARSALGAERSSPQARTRGGDQTAAGYRRCARWIWASRRGRVRGRQPTAKPASGTTARAEPWSQRDHPNSGIRWRMRSLAAELGRGLAGWAEPHQPCPGRQPGHAK